LKKKKIRTEAMPPTGRLIQKLRVLAKTPRNPRGMLTYHQRQVALSAKTPPKIGPRTLDNPYAAPTIPISPGRILGSAANAMIVNAPVAVAEAPTPAIARPTTMC
jgi:hypothetical protein